MPIRNPYHLKYNIALPKGLRGKVAGMAEGMTRRQFKKTFAPALRRARGLMKRERALYNKIPVAERTRAQQTRLGNLDAQIRNTNLILAGKKISAGRTFARSGRWRPLRRRTRNLTADGAGAVVEVLDKSPQTALLARQALEKTEKGLVSRLGRKGVVDERAIEKQIGSIRRTYHSMRGLVERSSRKLKDARVKEIADAKKKIALAKAEKKRAISEAEGRMQKRQVRRQYRKKKRGAKKKAAIGLLGIRRLRAGKRLKVPFVPVR